MEFPSVLGDAPCRVDRIDTNVKGVKSVSGQPKTRVVVLEDAPFILGALLEFLGAQPDLEVIGAYRTCEEFLSAASGWSDDVGIAIIDIGLPDGDGVEAWQSLCRVAARHVPVLVFSGKASLDDLRRVQEGTEGGVGILSKDGSASAQTIRQAIDAIRAGFMMVDPSITAGATRGSVAKVLSEQELEVLRLMAEGLSNNAIHEQMYVSVKRVEGIVTTIYEKLGLHRSSSDLNPRVAATLIFLGLSPLH